MTMETKLLDGTIQVNLSGSIYAEDALAIRESFTSLIESGKHSFLIDLSQVDYIDSTGLGTLMFIRNRLKRNGSELTLTGLQGLVRDLFEMTRLTQVFNISH